MMIKGFLQVKRWYPGSSVPMMIGLPAIQSVQPSASGWTHIRVAGDMSPVIVEEEYDWVVRMIQDASK